MGSKTQTATATSAPSPQAMQAYESLLPQIENVATTAMGETVPTLGTAPVNAQQQAGIGNVNQYATYAIPTIDAATGLAYHSAQPITASDISRYESPYTQDVVNTTEAQFQNQNAQQQQQVRGNAIAQGAMGGNREAVAEAELANQQNLAQAPVIASLENQGFTTGLNTALTEQQMGQAGAYTLGNLGVAGEQAALSGAGAQIGAGTLEQQTAQAENLARFQQEMGQLALPLEATQYEAGALTGVGSQMGGTSTTTQPGPNLLSQLGGLAVAGVGMYGMSDRRLKENIRRIGKLYDGQIIYRFNYKGDPATRIGLIAQDVEKRHPDAIHEVGGFKAVDYDEATRDAIRRASGGGVNYPTFGGGYGSPKVPFGGAESFIPTIGITRARDIPSPPRIAEQPDPGKQMQGWVNEIKGLNPGKGTPTVPSPGIAPSDLPGLPGGIGHAFRGGAVDGYADGGTPTTPEDIDPESLPRGLVLPPEARAAGEVFAPSLTRYLSSPRGDSPAPTVLPSGKISSADPRMGPVASDVAGLATLPLGLAGAAPEMAAARLAPGLAAPLETADVAAGRAAAPAIAASMIPEATAAMRSAIGRGRAYDLMAGVGSGAGAMPTAAAAGPLDGPGTRPTAMPDELDRITELNKQIAAINAQRAAAVAKATSAARGVGPLGVKVRQDTAAAPFDTQIGRLNGEISTINKNITDRQALWDQHKAEYDIETAPFATRHPEQATALRGLPALSPIGGLVLGRFAGRTISPLKRLATYGAAGLGGGLEGGIGAYYPTLADAGMPRGTQAKTEADINNPNPSFWTNDIAPEVGFGAALGVLGAKYGMLRRPAGVAPSVAPAVAEAAKAWPKRLAPADMVQDAAGRWRLANPVGGYNRGAFIPKNLQPPGSALSASTRTANIIPAEANGGVVRGYQDGGSPDDGPTLPPGVGWPTPVPPEAPPSSGPRPFHWNPDSLGRGVTAIGHLFDRSAPASEAPPPAEPSQPESPAAPPTTKTTQDRAASTPVTGGVVPPVVDETGVTLDANLLGLVKNPSITVAGDPEARPPPPPDGLRSLVPASPSAIPPRTVGEGAERSPASPTASVEPPAEPTRAPAAGVDWSANSKLWPALMAAGFGMMASRSPFAGVAIGEGGETGLQMYAGEKAQEMKQAQLDMEARKLDQEMRLQQQRLGLEERPYSEMTVAQRNEADYRNRQLASLDAYRRLARGTDLTTPEGHLVSTDGIDLTTGEPVPPGTPLVRAPTTGRGAAADDVLKRRQGAAKSWMDYLKDPTNDRTAPEGKLDYWNRYYGVPTDGPAPAATPNVPAAPKVAPALPKGVPSGSEFYWNQNLGVGRWLAPDGHVYAADGTPQ